MRLVHPPIRRTIGTILSVVLLVACGGDDERDPPPADTQAAPVRTDDVAPTDAPADWFVVDEGARTVTIDLVAGATTANQSWNFNGYFNGGATITVPEGFTVTVHFSNEDPSMAHSAGVDVRSGGFPPNMSPATPAFEGAITENALSIDGATQPGERESFSFVASSAGEYGLACYLPGHAVTGMWIRFNVSDDGSSGVLAR